MDKWSILVNVLGLAVGAGLNLYAAVLVTGLGIRYGWLTNMPGDLAVMGHPVVLTVAGVMYALEFVADKVPFFTPIWDGVHTFIRPVGGAMLALSATADMDPMVKLLAVLGAGTLALGAHSSKMGFRLMAHSTPEPATHSAISLAEDFGVVAILLLAFQYPWLALPILVVIVAGIVMFLPLLFRICRFLLAGLLGRVASWLSIRPEVDIPRWVPDRGDAVRVFVRRVKGAPRLADGWFHPRTGRLHMRRWGSREEMAVGRLAPGLEWGFIYCVARTSGGASFYLTKEWSACLKTAPTATSASASRNPA